MSAPLNDPELREIRERAERATPGPWAWFGNARTRSVYLATQFWGRHFVMQFQRWGMRDAQPVFRVPIHGDYGRQEGRPRSATMRPLSELFNADAGFLTDHNEDICAVGHPDADFIAHARRDVDRLLDEIERLRAAVAALEYLERYVAATPEQPHGGDVEIYGSADGPVVKFPDCVHDFRAATIADAVRQRIRYDEIEHNHPAALAADEPRTEDIAQ